MQYISPLKREFEDESTTAGSPIRKQQLLSSTEKETSNILGKQNNLNPKELKLKEESGLEVLVAENEEVEVDGSIEDGAAGRNLFNKAVGEELDEDDNELELEDEDEGVDAEEEEDGDEEEDEDEQDETERLAEVLGVEVFEQGDNVGSSLDRRGISAVEQQEEANRVEDRKLLALMAHFNDDHLSRFESYRRATFTKSAVSRIIQSVAQTSFSQNVVIAMAGITKVFVGELVETALDYKEELKETGPLQPKHIRVAYARMQGRQLTSRSHRLNPLL